MKERSMTLRLVEDRLARAVGIGVISVLFSALLLIVYYVTSGALSHFSWDMLTTFGNTTSGGILNAIIGTWLLIGISTATSFPLGLVTAIYLSEYRGRLSGLIRLSIDVLASVPSMVLGLFGYLVYVIYLGMGFSLLAGGLTLSLMMVPYVARSSEIAFLNVPKELREAAYALGATKWQYVSRVLLRAAWPLVASGVVLSSSIAAGETAQLLYTAGWNTGLPSALTRSQVPYLTYVVWSGINQPSAYANGLAYVSAEVLIVTVFSLMVLSKVLERRGIAWKRS